MSFKSPPWLQSIFTPTFFQQWAVQFHGFQRVCPSFPDFFQGLLLSLGTEQLSYTLFIHSGSQETFLAPPSKSGVEVVKEQGTTHTQTHSCKYTHIQKRVLQERVKGLRLPRTQCSESSPGYCPWQEVTPSTSCSVSWGPSYILFLAGEACLPQPCFLGWMTNWGSPNCNFYIKL